MIRRPTPPPPGLLAIGPGMTPSTPPPPGGKLFLIPEVACLIERQVAAGAGLPLDRHRAQLAALPHADHAARVLRDVCAWLVINSARATAARRRIQ